MIARQTTTQGQGHYHTHRVERGLSFKCPSYTCIKCGETDICEGQRHSHTCKND